MRLKKLLPIMLSVILCFQLTAQNVKKASNYVQVFELASELPNVNNKYTFENDTLKITYYFWGERGIVQIGIKNKLNAPIYINWEKSFYKNNLQTLSYFPEGVVTKENIDAYNSYLYGGRVLTAMDYELQQQTASSNEFETKIEGYTEIKPLSYYMRLKYHVVPEDFFTLDDKAKSSSVKASYDDEATATVYTKQYKRENTPLYFESFITYSMTNKFETEYDILNKFWVIKVEEMDAKHFRGEKVGKDPEGKPIYKFPLRESTKFYCEINKKKSLEFKSK